jgi:hypothetical protein
MLGTGIAPVYTRMKWHLKFLRNWKVDDDMDEMGMRTGRDDDLDRLREHGQSGADGQ